MISMDLLWAWLKLGSTLNFFPTLSPKGDLQLILSLKERNLWKQPVIPNHLFPNYFNQHLFQNVVFYISPISGPLVEEQRKPFLPCFPPSLHISRSDSNSAITFSTQWGRRGTNKFQQGWKLPKTKHVNQSQLVWPGPEMCQTSLQITEIILLSRYKARLPKTASCNMLRTNSNKRKR